MGYQLIKVPDDPNNPPFSLTAWLQGHKTYITAAVATAKIWYVAVYGHPWSDQVDSAINVTLVAAGAAALRSAMKTSTAQITNAVTSVKTAQPPV